jgi:repressor LexA
MKPTLYNRQRQILYFISLYIKKFGYAPTLNEIADAIGVSALSTVYEHLSSLEKKGYIRRYKGALRGIEILNEDDSTESQEVELPVLGFIAAGEPIEPYYDPEATVMVPQSMVTGKKKAFVLQVKGESMIEEGILDGDYVIIEEQEEAKDGDVVVAVLGNGFATLKRFFKEKNRIRLEPANSTMKPIYTTNVTIKGRVTGVLRSFK